MGRARVCACTVWDAERAYADANAGKLNNFDHCVRGLLGEKTCTVSLTGGVTGYEGSCWASSGRVCSLTTQWLTTGVNANDGMVREIRTVCLPGSCGSDDLSVLVNCVRIHALTRFRVVDAHENVYGVTRRPVDGRGSKVTIRISMTCEHFRLAASQNVLLTSMWRLGAMFISQQASGCWPSPVASSSRAVGVACAAGVSSVAGGAAEQGNVTVRAPCCHQHHTRL